MLEWKKKGSTDKNPRWKFKTAICWNYLSGNCKFGEKCDFAHGKEDIREFNPTKGKDLTSKCTDTSENSLCKLV